MFGSDTQSPHPLLIIGIDGGDWHVIDAMIASGELPHLRRLAESGMRTELRSTLPTATLPAWNAFLCAADPAEHGVTDMFVHPPTRNENGARSYDLTPATAMLRRLPTFLSVLARRGLAIASLGVPGTYPPDPSLGLCIAGFDAPGADRASRQAIHPASLLRVINQLGGWRYSVFNEQRSAGRRLARLGPALVADLAVKEKIAIHAYTARRWDVFFLHLQAADTAGHHLWHTYDDSSARWQPTVALDALPSVYRRIDALIGRLLAHAPAATRTLILSDHGMTAASDVAVHVNRALEQIGVLRFKTRHHAMRQTTAKALSSLAACMSPAVFALSLRLVPQKILSRLLSLSRGRSVDYAASAAFSDELDYAPSVWINRRGVFPQGNTASEDVPATLARIRACLLALRHPDNGEPLIRAVHTRESAFFGPYAELAPDLTIEPNPLHRASFLPSRSPGPSVRHLQAHELCAARGAGMPGVHRREGIFIAHGPGLEAMTAPVLGIAEAGALAYSLAGQATPDRAMAKLRGFWRSLATQLSPQVASDAATPSLSTSAYSAAEQTSVLRRLRELGYIE